MTTQARKAPPDSRTGRWRPGNTPAPGTPRVVIKRLAMNGLSFPVGAYRLSALPADGHMPNGMTLGPDGHPVVCEQGTRSEPARISRVDPVTGPVESLVDGWGGPGPSPFQLWEDLQDLHRRIKADFDPTTAQARAAWMAPDVPQPARG
jgi:hypothetical protein